MDKKRVRVCEGEKGFMKKLRNIFKKCTAFILMLALFVTSINVSAFADVITGSVIYNDTSFDSIEEALVVARENGNKTPIIYLKENIDFSGSISLKENENVTISSYTDSKVTISLTSETSKTTILQLMKIVY